MNVTGINKNNKEWMIAIIITYLFILLCLATYAIGAMSLGWLPAPYAPLPILVVVYIVFVQFTSINALENNGIQIGMYGISSAHLPVQLQVQSVTYFLKQDC
nr:hypothetical protein OKNFBMNL_00304 [Klebsiella quasipneumoniae subsp. quasipneumoniae]